MYLKTAILKIIRAKHTINYSHNDLLAFTEDRIRNFCIVAHVNHGKSTLADRLLELTGTIVKSPNNQQVMDQMNLERSRGITIKAKTATMIHQMHGNSYMLNLIDTPGHVDFSFEVTRALSACDGVLLLIDVSQGIQAQTLSNFNIVRSKGLHVIPVLNKIDIQNINIDLVTQNLSKVFKFPTENIHKISAKTGHGIEDLLSAIIRRIPPPLSENSKKPFSALMFDSFYDTFRGVVCIVAVKSGKLVCGDVVIFNSAPSKTYTVKEVGIFKPSRSKISCLRCGFVGYVVLGLKNAENIFIGDTLTHINSHNTGSISHFIKPRPSVYACVYPGNSDDSSDLREAVQKLILSDSSVSVSGTIQKPLGAGFKIGFLGHLHMEVFCHRLKEEFSKKIVVTPPSVTYKAILKKNKEEHFFTFPSEYPERFYVESYLEPFVVTSIVSPKLCLEVFKKICCARRGELINFEDMDDQNVLIKFLMPLSEIMTDFSMKIKHYSSGYASVTHEDAGYKPSKIVSLNVFINKKSTPFFGRIVHIDDVEKNAKQICQKLLSLLPKHTFELDIQVIFQKKTISRVTIQPHKDDPTRKCYGGDITRKLKLRTKQAKKLKNLKLMSDVNIPHEVYCEYAANFTLE